MEMQSKKLNELRKGDIIRTRVPFEENTYDYYNGYRPQDIRGSLYKDRMGQTSKPRFFVVVGWEENNVIGLPLTSRHSEYNHDNYHHYTLQDNSMTWKHDPDMKSYVEVDSLRAVYVNPKWDIQYMGAVKENDMVNIMVKVGKHGIDFKSQRDQRAYISRNKEEMFEKTLKKNGYELKEQEFESKTYKKDDGRTVTKSKWGLVWYHVPLSKEEVSKLVAKREGKPVDDFTRAVTDITEKSAVMESGAGK